MAYKETHREWHGCQLDYHREFSVNTEADIATLPKCATGSTAIVAATGKRYVCNASGEWVERENAIGTATGGGGGGLFIVNVTMADGIFVADKTADEIIAAFEAGKNVICVAMGSIATLNGIFNDEYGKAARFIMVNAMSDGNIFVITITIDSVNGVSYCEVKVTGKVIV